MSAEVEPKLVEVHRGDKAMIYLIINYCGISTRHISLSLTNFNVGFALRSGSSLSSTAKDKLYGFILGQVSEDATTHEKILTISILCAESRQGYGKQLLENMLAYADDSDIRKVQLTALDETWLIKFYQSYGFVIDEESRENENSDIEGVDMTRITQ